MPDKQSQAARPSIRNPGRTRGKILAAALQDFAAHGFAGARVDAIARRAKINKRMLYHYFGDKSGLFRAVLRQKISDRTAKFGAQAKDRPAEGAARLWFEQNCEDADWVRLLAWESLQAGEGKVMDAAARREAALSAIARIQREQSSQRLRADTAAEFLLLAKVSLSMFPFALPQVVRLILGCSPHDRKFQRDYAKFLETISAGFRPTGRSGNKSRNRL